MLAFPSPMISYQMPAPFRSRILTTLESVVVHMNYLKKVISEIDSGKSNLQEHELIED